MSNIIYILYTFTYIYISPVKKVEFYLINSADTTVYFLEENRTHYLILYIKFLID